MSKVPNFFERNTSGHCGVENRVINFIGWGFLIALGSKAVIDIRAGNGESLKEIALVGLGSLGALLANTGRGNQGTPQNPVSTTVQNTGDPIEVVSEEK